MTRDDARKSTSFSRWGIIGILAGVALVSTWVFSETELLADKSGETQAVDTKILARIGEVEITEDEVRAGVAAQLKDLDRQRYDLISQALNQVVGEKMIELEAESLGLTSEALVEQEVNAKLPEVTDGEVDAFFEAQKGRINQPKEAIAPQIRQYLQQQRSASVYTNFIKGLEVKYKPDTFLDPIRAVVESAGFPAKGPDDAPVTIVEFSDFQCPYCSRVVPSLDKVTEEYGDRVRLVFRQFPLNSIHPQAQKAAEASLCAHDQGKFWEMHDEMFKNQSALGIEALKSAAETLELDTEGFMQCLDSGKHAEAVAADLDAGASAGVSGTPALFINGRFLSGAQPYEKIAEVIDDELKRLEL